MENKWNVKTYLLGSADQTRTTYPQNKLFMDLVRSNAKQTNIQTNILVSRAEPIKA
jgi:hypothetical protein